jgi:hypothetical protein
MMKTILKTNKIPPEKQDQPTETVLKQAEGLDSFKESKVAVYRRVVDLGPCIVLCPNPSAIDRGADKLAGG